QTAQACDYLTQPQHEVISLVFFFSSRRRHTRFSRDWSSDVCSSDLELEQMLTRMHDYKRPATVARLRGITRLTIKKLCDHSTTRSEERRVGKECRSWWMRRQYN